MTANNRVIFWSALAAVIMTLTVHITYWLGYRHGSRYMKREYTRQYDELVATGVLDLRQLPVRNQADHRANPNINAVEMFPSPTNR